MSATPTRHCHGTSASGGNPSEIGEATWQRSEPPLTIGRGLLVTTGAVGGLLALAVLWAMLPTGAGGGPQAISTEPVRTTRHAVSTVRDATSSSDSATFAATTHTSAPTTLRATSPSTAAAGTTGTTDTDGATTEEATTTPVDATGTTDPTSSSDTTPDDGSLATTSGVRSSTTAASVNAPTATISVGGAAGPTTAIAVAVGGVQVVLTTASAVRQSSDTVTLSFDDGRTAQATVAMTVNGVAMLTTADESAATATFKIASSPHDGDTVTLLGTEPATVAVHVGDDGNLSLPSWGDGDVAEGTPVVNAQGKVVALCSRSSTGPKLVTINQTALRNALDSATNASTASTAPGKAYLGLKLNADPKGSLTIYAVEPDGPAAAAGIVAGDTVIAVDDEALSSSDELADVLAEHVPDDAVSVTVEHVDGTQSTIDVVLAISPTRA